MKNYNMKIGWMFFALFLFFSCNNDFLEQYPLDTISNETVWKTENDLMVYNNRLYDMTRIVGTNSPGAVSMLRTHTEWSETAWLWDLWSDNMSATFSNVAYYNEIRAGKHSITTNPRKFGYNGWDFVRACNVGLDNYDNNTTLAEEIRNKYKAEARLFRGWFYSDKVSKFGDVQWVDHELNIDSEELYAARNPREEVMGHVLDDLNFACQYLPENWGLGNRHGRLDRWCALVVKSRVCLFEGTWRKYHGGTNPDLWLQEAANAAKELMEKGPFSLYKTGKPATDYNASFRMMDLTGNPEVIFWRKYIEGQDPNNVYILYRSRVSATKSMVEDYLCTDGNPITLTSLYQGDAKIEDVFVNRDPRLRQTVLHPDDRDQYDYGVGTIYPSFLGQQKPEHVSESGYHIVKTYIHNQAMATWRKGTQPAICLRLGEVLLNYAEAMAELGSITQPDLDMSINKLRDRVAMPHLVLGSIPVDPRYANDGVSPVITEIRRERRVELFMEGFRYDDLRRWKQGKKLETPDMGILWDGAAIARYPKATVFSSTDPVSGKTYIDAYKNTDYANPVFDESKHYLWPIPLSVISQNPNIGQNPGW